MNHLWYFHQSLLSFILFLLFFSGILIAPNRKSERIKEFLMGKKERFKWKNSLP